MYINVDKACRLGLIGRVKVKLNGAVVNKCVAAKDGKNGFVEYLTDKVNTQGDGLVRVKRRGNVKVSFNLNG